MTENAIKGTRGFVSTPLANRFWAKVDRRGPDECWPWLGSKFASGCGQIWRDGRHTPAPRVSWELENNEAMPPELDACHTCDNPNCVNPKHIWPGTPTQNAKDAVAKGRIVSVWRGKKLSPETSAKRWAGRHAKRLARLDAQPAECGATDFDEMMAYAKIAGAKP